jgi:hypothetical protein
MTSPRRTGLIVAGMHRSGTSALARLINLLGADMPRDIEPPNISNEDGHWEPKPVLALHDRIFARFDARWSSLSAIGDDALRSTADGKNLIEDIKSVIVGQYGNWPFFVLKDPRICLFISYWRTAFDDLGIGAKFVFAFRNPLDVAESLRDREAADAPGEVWDIDRGGLLWLHYVLAAESATRGQPRVFLRYDDLLDDWRAEAARMAQTLNIDWPGLTPAVEIEIDAFLKPARRHHAAAERDLERGGPWSALIKPVYDRLCAMRADPRGAGEAFDVAHEQFAAARLLFGGYVDSYERNVVAMIAARGRERVEAARDLKQREAARVIVRAEAARNLGQAEAALSLERAEAARLRSELEVGRAARLAIEATLAAERHRGAEEAANHGARTESQDHEIAQLRDSVTRLQSIERSTFWRASGPVRRALIRHPRLTRGLRRLLQALSRATAFKPWR